MELAGINPLYLIAGLALLGLAPFLLMMVTSYVKIVVVTSLVRNALGVQQVPPAMVMNGLAIILTVFIMAPVAMDTKALLEEQRFSANPKPSEMLETLQAVSPPSRFSASTQPIAFSSCAARITLQPLLCAVRPSTITAA